MSRFKHEVQAQDLHRWFNKLSVPYFYLLSHVLALSCLLLLRVWHKFRIFLAPQEEQGALLFTEADEPIFLLPC